VNAQTASASTYSSWCQRPSAERGSGTRASHSRRQRRDASSPAAGNPDAPAGTSISEDSNTGTVPPKVVHGSRLRSWRTVPARSNQAPGRQCGTRAQPVNHAINQGTDTNLAGAV